MYSTIKPVTLNFNQVPRSISQRHRALRTGGYHTVSLMVTQGKEKSPGESPAMQIL